MLAHWISMIHVDVDKTNTETIPNLQLPTLVKRVRSFLGYVRLYRIFIMRLYRRFIMDLSNISKSLCNLLIKDVSFDFNDKCMKAFVTLKREVNIGFNDSCTRLDTTFSDYVWCKWLCNKSSFEANIILEIVCILLCKHGFEWFNWIMPQHIKRCLLFSLHMTSSTYIWLVLNPQST